MREWPVRFLGGDCVLDFLNTAGGTTKARDVERLNSYGDVLAWALAASIINDGECEELRRAAAASPDVANQCLDDLRNQRERIYNFVAASIAGRSIPEIDRVNVEGGMHAALQHARLAPAETQLLQWQLELNSAGLSLIKYRLDLAASTLLTGPSGRNIRQCEMCSWLFLDVSESKRRRWCSMAICGNRAKAQRHYYRRR